MIMNLRYLMICLLPYYLALDYQKSFLASNLSAVHYCVKVYKDTIIHTTSTDIYQRDLNTGRIIRILRGSTAIIKNFLIANGTDLLYAISFDGQVQVWNLTSGTLNNRFVIPGSPELYALALTQNSLFVGGTDSKINRLNLQNGRVSQFFDIQMVTISVMLVHSQFLFAGTMSSRLRLGRWRLTSGALDGTYAGHTYPLAALYIENHRLFSGSFDGVVFKWDYIFFEILATYRVPIVALSTIIVNQGKLYVGGGVDFGIYVYDVDSTNPVRVLRGAMNSILSMELHDDFLIASGSQGIIHMWNLTSGLQVAQYQGFDPRLRRVVVTSRSVFTMGNAGILQVWDKESGNEKLLQSYDVGFGIFAVAMSKDHLYIGGMVLQILEWDIETMLPLRNFLGHLNSVSYLLLVDQILYSGSRDYTLKSWDIQSASVIRDFFEPNDYAIYIAVSPEWLYSLGGDSGYLSRWNLTGGTRLFHMYAASDRSNANCMAITDDYILAGLASQIFIFRAGDLSLVTTLSPGKQLAPYAMIVNGDILYVGYVNGDVIIWNLYTFEQTFTIKGHSDYISSFEIDNNNLFSVSGDGTMKRWNLDNLRQSFTFRDRSNAITAIYLAEGKLWTGTLQGNVDVYDISTAFLVNTLEPKGGSIQIFFENKSGGLNALTEQGRVVDLKKRSAIAELSSDEIVVSSFFFREVLYFSDKSNHLKMWNSTEQLTPEIIFTSSQVSIVTITADEENVYVAQSDYVIMAIGRFDKAVLSKFIGHKGQVLCLISWGEYLLSSSDDKTIIMWQKSTGELRAQLSRSLNSLGHLGAVKYIVICESTLFSGGADNVVRQWNLESLSHEDVFVGHTKQVNVIMCHNSSFVFSGGDDQAIFMWAPKISRISEATRAATQLSGQSVARSRRAVFSVKANNIAANNIVIIVAVVSAVIAILALAVLILKLRKLNLWHSAKDFILNSNISDSTQSSPFAYDPTLLNTILGLSKPAYLLVKDEELIMERQIAKGGGGQVFIGRCLSKQAIGRSGRETIIVKKTANDYESLSKTQKSLFDQEVSLMEYLGAKDHIAKIIGYTNRPCCILMKFYPEGSLENWIEKLTPLLRAQFCLDIANGIFNMHSLLVAHCDLKPQNILIETIEYKGQCRPVCFLTDFGISNILSDTILSSRNFNVVNLRGLSVYYASPEAFSRFRQKLFSDSIRLKASDIYSFGAIAYHLLTRKAPWN